MFRGLLIALGAALALLATLVVATHLLTPDDPLYTPANALPDYRQPSFEAYVDDTRQWIADNRVFLTDNPAAEVDGNAPFELQPRGGARATRGALLVHGLGDSPFYLRDLAAALAEQGFLVRTLLLPGHGTRPADLTLPDYDDWRTLVAHHVALLQAEVEGVWLGGFSTGANLVTAYAAQHDAVRGLLLFSPAFVPRDVLHVLAPFANHLINWIDFDPHENNYTRYSTLAMNGGALLSRSVRDVNARLSAQPYTQPALIVISESDSVVNADAVLEHFQTHFTHPDSRLIWYGSDRTSDERVASLPASLPEQRISTFSHMGVLFAPNNPYYGQDGSQRICDNGQDDAAEARCPTADDLWFSSFDHVEAGKTHARLTWNPHFDHLVETIEQLVN
ncbi:MAG: alpha/beta fold hydrolase [Pseudomonadota bacterium]